MNGFAEPCSRKLFLPFTITKNCERKWDLVADYKFLNYIANNESVLKNHTGQLETNQLKLITSTWREVEIKKFGAPVLEGSTDLESRPPTSRRTTL